MTPQAAYRAALEAAAKVADRQYEAYLKAANKAESETMSCRFDQKSDACNLLAAAIRALPVPEDAGDMVMVPREPTEAMIAAVAQALHEVEWANVRPPLSYLNDMDGGEWWERAARAAIRAMINAKER